MYVGLTVSHRWSSDMITTTFGREVSAATGLGEATNDGTTSSRAAIRIRMLSVSEGDRGGLSSHDGARARLGVRSLGRSTDQPRRGHRAFAVVLPSRRALPGVPEGNSLAGRCDSGPGDVSRL